MEKTFVKIFDSIGAKIIFPAIPTIWFSFFAIFAPSYEKLIVQGKLTALAIILNIIVFIVVVFYIVASIYCQSVKQKQKNVDEKTYMSILQNLDDANIFLRNKQTNVLFEHEDSNYVSDYRSNINVLLMLLVKCLSEVTNVDESKFVASYFYKFKNDGWKIINSDGKHKGVDVSIIEDKSSVVSQLIREDSAIFYLSKEEANKKGNYFIDERDKEQKEICESQMGSIFGLNWSISNQISGDVILSSIITVATYGEQICDSEDVRIKKVIIDQILKMFENPFLFLAFDYVESLKKRENQHVTKQTGDKV